MERMKYLLVFSSILFMVNRTSHAISVDPSHNSTIPTPTSPFWLPPRILRSKPSPPPPPQRNTPSDTTPSPDRLPRILRSTPSPPPPPQRNTPSDKTPTRILRSTPSPPPPPQRNTPFDTTPSPDRLPPRILRSTPSPPPPPQRNTPSDTTPTRTLRSTPSPPPPPQRNTPSDTTPTRTLRSTPSPPLPPQRNIPSDTTPTRILRSTPSPPPPPQRNIPSDTTPTRILGSTPSHLPPPHGNTPTDRFLSSTLSKTASFHSTPGSTQLDDLGDSVYSQSKHPADPKLKRLCAHTDYPSLCLSSLSPSLAGAKSFSLTTALRVAIKAATSHARLAVAAATRLAASRDAAEDDKESLGNCKDAYGDALDNLQAALEATPSKDIGTVNSMLSAVITDSENCGDALDGTEAGTTMSKYDDKLRKLASNGLAIASLIN